MHRIIVCFFTALLCVLQTAARNPIEVKEFKEVNISLPVNQEKVYDQEGELCPLVIVRNVTIDGFKFPDAIKTIPGKDPKTNEDIYWVYLQSQSKKIKITNPAHKELGEVLYNAPFSLRPGVTYDLYLDISLPKAIGGKQYLTFNVSPQNATVEVFRTGQSVGDMWTVTNGNATREVDPGTYYVAVSAPNYHQTQQEIQFDGDEPKTITIELKPNFGFLTIKQTDDLAGAGIYIDNINVATGSLSDHIISSGSHNLKISKELYKTYETEFSISDNQHLLLEPNLIADFATTSVSTSDPNAEIWRDNKLLGKGAWRGPLPKGAYMFETRRENHRSKQKMVKVESITEPIDITLEAPEPILGSLSVESSPMGAKIEIDGADKGITPRSFHDLLVGSHSVTLSMPGYQAITKEVSIAENEPKKLSETLSNISSVKITCGSHARLTIDGQFIPNHAGEYIFEAPVGSQHTAEVTGEGYTTVNKKFTIPANGNLSVNLRQKELLLKKKCAYIDLGAAAPGNIAIYGAVGGYISGFNMELSALFGIQKSQEFFFSGANGTSENRYKSYELGARLGYGIHCGTRIMLTPQIGVNDVIVQANKEVHGTLKSAHVCSGVGGLRAYVAFTESVGLALIPEYRFKIAAPDAITLMMQSDKRIKNWIEGFNCKLCFTVCF